MILGIVVPPFLLAFFGAVSFVNAIFFAGTFGGITMSVLPVFMLNQARKKGDTEPVWQCGWIAGKCMQGLVLLIFSGAGIYALLSLAGLLPAGW